MAQRATLAALADRVIPADDAPGGSASGAVAFIEALLDRELAPRCQELSAFLDELTEANFIQLSPPEQDLLLQAHQTRGVFRLVAETIHEAYWTSSTGKALVGFVERG